MVLFFCGKFGTKPKLNMFFKRPSPHFVRALKTGFAQFLFQISVGIPALTNRKILSMTLSGTSDDEYNVLMAALNAQIRVWVLVLSVANAMNMALIPSASFALGAERYRRILNLLKHGLWMAIAWSAFVMIFLVGFPKLIGRAFSTTPEFLDMVENAFRASFTLVLLQPVQPLLQGLLQSQRRNLRASLLALFTRILPIPVFAGILYLTDKHNTERIFWANTMDMALVCVLGIVFAGPAIKDIWNAAKENPRIEPEDAVGDALPQIEDDLVRTETPADSL
jgi:Na+-driven multidrug efflux pump